MREKIKCPIYGTVQIKCPIYGTVQIKCPIYGTLYFFVPIVTKCDNGALLFVDPWCKLYAAKGRQFYSLGIVKKCDSGLVSKASKVWPRPEARPK